uniref:G_PROTEIN_RECEP_F1_2 domain-containing protein n=1 Tax=Meloidogyne floridensis TaxID=298350 RepID=A0A915PBD0_9BILA
MSNIQLSKTLNNSSEDQSIFLLGTLPPLIIVMSGINFITVSRCIWIQWLPLFAFFSQITLCLCIGVDRLVAVGFPILPVICLATDISPQSYFSMSLLLNLVTPILYVIVDQQYNKTICQIFKAVFSMMILQLFGWLNNQILQIVITYLNLDLLTSWFVRNIGAFPLYVALALDALALYLFSHDYRKNFNKCFPQISSLFCKNPNASNKVLPFSIHVQKSKSLVNMDRIDIIRNTAR